MTTRNNNGKEEKWEKKGIKNTVKYWKKKRLKKIQKNAAFASVPYFKMFNCMKCVFVCLSFHPCIHSSVRLSVRLSIRSLQSRNLLSSRCVSFHSKQRKRSEQSCVLFWRMELQHPQYHGTLEHLNKASVSAHVSTLQLSFWTFLSNRFLIISFPSSRFHMKRQPVKGWKITLVI